MRELDVFDRVRQFWGPREKSAPPDVEWEQLRKRTPLPVFWLFGKTQSGKTAIIRYLTEADDAEIGVGFRPCTRFSREYLFPTSETPLLRFIDTRGIDEPGYDPTDDIRQFNDQAHVVVITVKAMDHAQESVLRGLRRIRDGRRDRPVVLALTCLHEGYPHQGHPEPYSFTSGLNAPNIPENLRRSLLEHERRFAGLVDATVAVDLTRPEDGFSDPNYGGIRLKSVLIDALPHAYRQTLLTLDRQTGEFRDLAAKRALPYIIAFSTTAASAAAFPVPWVDLAILPTIQTRMVYRIAKVYGQPLTHRRFLEFAGALGSGLLVRQAVREVTKAIPYLGSVASAAFAGATTFAIGKAFCLYYSEVLTGHVPDVTRIKTYFDQELRQARQFWH
jgi:uncharacterized protein (DUF697 family)